MEEKILEIIVKELGVSQDKISLDTEIGEPPEWDSLNNVKIFGSIEERFAIKISPEHMMDLETVADIVQLVSEAVR